MLTGIGSVHFPIWVVDLNGGRIARTEQEFEESFRLLAKLHETCNELRKIGECKFPDPENASEEVRAYQQGWNDAVDFILSGGHWQETTEKENSDMVEWVVWSQGEKFYIETKMDEKSNKIAGQMFPEGQGKGERMQVKCYVKDCLFNDRMRCNHKTQYGMELITIAPDYVGGFCEDYKEKEAEENGSKEVFRNSDGRRTETAEGEEPSV